MRKQASHFHRLLINFIFYKSVAKCCIRSLRNGLQAKVDYILNSIPNFKNNVYDLENINSD